MKQSNKALIGSLSLTILLVVLTALTLKDSAERYTANAPSATPTVTPTPTHVHTRPPQAPTATPTRTPRPSLTPTSTATPNPLGDGFLWYSDENITVYTRENRLCLLEDGGTPVFFADVSDTLDFDVTVSPDGAVVVVVLTYDIWPDERMRFLNQEIWAINQDGSNRRLVLTMDDFEGVSLENAALEILQATWIPGTHLLAFTTGERPLGDFYYGDLHMLDIDTGAYTVLLPADGWGGPFYPSPDGTRIAVTTQGSVDLINVDGSNYREGVVTYDVALTYSESNVTARPVWSPDSEGVWVTVPPPDQFHGDTTITTWYAPANGSEAIQIAAFETQPLNLWSNNFAVFSPDGAYVALWESGDDIAAIRVVSADGVEEHFYYPIRGRIGFLRWEPDSRHFIFRTGDRVNLQRGEVDGGFVPLAAVEPIPEVPAQGCAPEG